MPCSCHSLHKSYGSKFISSNAKVIDINIGNVHMNVKTNMSVLFTKQALIHKPRLDSTRNLQGNH